MYISSKTLIFDFIIDFFEIYGIIIYNKLILCAEYDIRCNFDFMALKGVVMSIQLFSHNQIAYNSALDMLEQCGKAAIIHPTGTGKSFIEFKLCEEKSEAKICWLSPSEYIFRTQIENFKKAGGTEPKNICFILMPS